VPRAGAARSAELFDQRAARMIRASVEVRDPECSPGRLDRGIDIALVMPPAGGRNPVHLLRCHAGTLPRQQQGCGRPDAIRGHGWHVPIIETDGEPVVPRPSTRFGRDIDPDALNTRLSSISTPLTCRQRPNPLLGKHPKARRRHLRTPGMSEAAVPNCWIIGRRFRLAHAVSANKVIKSPHSARRWSQQTAVAGCHGDHETDTRSTRQRRHSRRGCLDAIRSTRCSTTSIPSRLSITSAA
jgi:hypothetical protein